MGALLNHNHNIKPLSRGAQVEVTQQVQRNDIVPDTETVTFPRNLRVDNHIANQVSALISLGISKDTKSLITELVQNKINELSKEDQHRLQLVLNSLEKKDYYTMQSRKISHK